MNKLLLLIVFTITTTLSVHAVEFNAEDMAKDPTFIPEIQICFLNK